MTADDKAADAFLLHFARTALAFGNPERVGVAVSGGSDSMALLHLLAVAAPEAGWTVHAVTVDHGLRPEAVEEARVVGHACARLGVSHDVLRWEHGAIRGNLQDAARRARYGLIAGWAKARGIGDVAVGHTADDQAETFLMELAREAGIDGLSGMPQRWEREGVRWWRPFLVLERQDLRDYLTRQGIGWIEDPTNADERFQRVRARKALAALAPLGITVAKLSGAATRLSMARQVVDFAATEAEERIGRTVAGEVIFERKGYGRLPPETARRVLVRALIWVSSAEYPPRGAEIERLSHAILQEGVRTLGGCRIKVSETEVSILREPRAVADAVSGTDELWDGRWRLEGRPARGLQVRALGTEGLKLCDGWRDTGASRAALIVSPAVWRGATLVAAPVAGLANGWTAKTQRSFATLFTLH